MDEFFTVASFGTLASCVVGVVAVMNTIRHVAGWGPRWFGLVLSILVSVTAFLVTGQMGGSSTRALNPLVRAMIVTVNGCFIYTSAFGIQNTVIAGMGGKARTPAQAPPYRVGSVW